MQRNSNAFFSPSLLFIPFSPRNKRSQRVVSNWIDRSCPLLNIGNPLRKTWTIDGDCDEKGEEKVDDKNKVK